MNYQKRVMQDGSIIFSISVIRVEMCDISCKCSRPYAYLNRTNRPFPYFKKKTETCGLTLEVNNNNH